MFKQNANRNPGNLSNGLAGGMKNGHHNYAPAASHEKSAGLRAWDQELARLTISRDQIGENGHGLQYANNFELWLHSDK